MRRAAAAIAATVTGLWLVLTFKSSPLPKSGAVSAALPTTTSSPTTSAPVVPSTTRGGGRSTTTTTSAPIAKTVDGDVIRTRYGDVQVEVVVRGSRIEQVQALQLPTDRPRSQSISEQAAPLLHDEVLRAQSAQIDTIGGATFTSEGYTLSLQSALERARGG